MINLTATTDVIDVVTDTTAAMDVHVSYVDYNGTTTTPGRQNTAIVTATTTTILSAPGASTQRNGKTINIRNKDASTTGNVTVRFNANGTICELHKASLRPGEMLSYVEGVGFFLYTIGAVVSETYSTADQAVAAASTVYLTGSALAISSARPAAIGTIFTWRLLVSKTAAGTAASQFDVRFGTGGSTADTARLTFAFGTESAVVDAGWIDIFVIVRGPISSSCVVAGGFRLSHNLAATGLGPTNDVVVQATSAAFDITTAGMIVGVSCTTGASDAFTFQLVNGKVSNI